MNGRDATAAGAGASAGRGVPRVRFGATYVALLVFAALLAFALYGPKAKDARSDAPAKAEQPAVLSFDREALRELSVRGKEGALVVRRDDGGKWELAQPRRLPADGAKMSGLAFTLSGLKAQRKVVDRAERPAEYGLDDPAYTVELGFKEGGSRKLLVGAKAPVGNAYYVRDAAADPVYLVDAWTLEPLFGKPFDFMEKTVAGFLSAEVEKFRVQASGAEFEARREKTTDKDGKEKDVWRIYADGSSPAEAAADAYDALGAVRAAQATDLPVERATAPREGFESWRLDVWVKGQADPQRYEFLIPTGKDGDGEKAFAGRDGDRWLYPVKAKEISDARAKFISLRK